MASGLKVSVYSHGPPAPAPQVRLTEIEAVTGSSEEAASISLKILHVCLCDYCTVEGLFLDLTLHVLHRDGAFHVAQRPPDRATRTGFVAPHNVAPYGCHL